MVKRYQIMSTTQKLLWMPFSSPFSANARTEERPKDMAGIVSQAGENILWMGCKTHCNKSSRFLEGHCFEKWEIRDLDGNICMRWGKGSVISLSISCWGWKGFPRSCVVTLWCLLNLFQGFLEVIAGAGCAPSHQHHHPPRRKQAQISLKVKIQQHKRIMSTDSRI